MQDDPKKKIVSIGKFNLAVIGSPVIDLKYKAPPKFIKYDTNIILLEIGCFEIFISLKQYLDTIIFEKKIRNIEV